MAHARANTSKGAHSHFDEEPGEYARLKRIFLKAVALADEERERFLDEACEGKPRLRGEVESLLRYHFEAVNDPDGPAEPET